MIQPFQPSSVETIAFVHQYDLEKQFECIAKSHLKSSVHGCGEPLRAWNTCVPVAIGETYENNRIRFLFMIMKLPEFRASSDSLRHWTFHMYLQDSFGRGRPLPCLPLSMWEHVTSMMSATGDDEPVMLHAAVRDTHMLRWMVKQLLGSVGVYV